MKFDYRMKQVPANGATCKQERGKTTSTGSPGQIISESYIREYRKAQSEGVKDNMLT
jgi:hypothetical protein